MCRSRRELSNAYLLEKFGFDTAENEPCKVCPIARRSHDAQLPSSPAAGERKDPKSRLTIPYLGSRSLISCQIWQDVSFPLEKFRKINQQFRQNAVKISPTIIASKMNSATCYKNPDTEPLGFSPLAIVETVRDYPP